MQIAQKYPYLFCVFYRFTKHLTRRKLCVTVYREMPMTSLSLFIILISILLVLVLIVESHRRVWAVRTVRRKYRR
jgi:hypothetical protein